MNLMYLIVCLLCLCCLNLHTRLVKVESRVYYNKNRNNINKNGGVKNEK